MSRMNRGKRPWKLREKKRFRKNRQTFSSSTHHLIPRSQGGEDGQTVTVRDDKHRAWHLLVKNNLPKEAANILSAWIPENDKFFAFNKNTPISDIVDEVNKWKGNSSEENCLSAKIIQLYPNRQIETDSFPKLVLFDQ